MALFNFEKFSTLKNGFRAISFERVGDKEDDHKVCHLQERQLANSILELLPIVFKSCAAHNSKIFS